MRSQDLVNKFDRDELNIGLEKIKSLVEEAQKRNFHKRFLLTIVVPGALIISLRIRSITKSNKNLDGFDALIEQELLLILFALVGYVVMWLYLHPIVLSIWHLFFQNYSWGDFFGSLFRWNTLQALLVTSLNFWVSQIALESFKLTSTFEDRYKSLKSLAQTIYKNPIEKAKLENEIIRQASEMMQNLINQTFTAMLANGEFDPNTAAEVTKVMKKTYYDILGNSDPEFDTEVKDYKLEKDYKLKSDDF